MQEPPSTAYGPTSAVGSPRDPNGVTPMGPAVACGPTVLEALLCSQPHCLVAPGPGKAAPRWSLSPSPPSTGFQDLLATRELHLERAPQFAVDWFEGSGPFALKQGRTTRRGRATRRGRRAKWRHPGGGCATGRGGATATPSAARQGQTARRLQRTSTKRAAGRPPRHRPPTSYSVGVTTDARPRRRSLSRHNRNAVVDQ